MKPNWLLRAALAALLSLTLTACTGASRQAQIDAGGRLGTVAAGVVIEPQPDECKRLWPDIPAQAGEGAQAVLRRYIEYVRGPINSRAARCFAFNENQRIGLTRK